MSLPLVRSSAAAAVGRTMQPWRRLLRDELLHRRPISSTAKEERMYADELKTTKKIFKELEELEMKLQREIVEDIEKVKRMESEDRNSLNRLMTSRGMVPWALRPAAVAARRAVWRAASAQHSFHAGRALGGNRRSRPLFSPLNRHNHEVNALLEEIKETKIGMVTRDTIIKTLHHSILGRQQILVQNVLRSWVVAAAAIAGYTWGYSRVAQHSAVGSFEPPTEHEERVD